MKTRSIFTTIGVKNVGFALPFVRPALWEEKQTVRPMYRILKNVCIAKPVTNYVLILP
jgi:hypothetical protein